MSNDRHEQEPENNEPDRSASAGIWGIVVLVVAAVVLVVGMMFLFGTDYHGDLPTTTVSTTDPA